MLTPYCYWATPGMRILCTVIPTEFLKNKCKRKIVCSPVSIPKEVQSVHGQWFHRTRAKPARTHRPPHGQVIHLGIYIIINDELEEKL